MILKNKQISDDLNLDFKLKGIFAIKIWQVDALMLKE